MRYTIGMTTIFCDICKKHIQAARKDMNYQVLLDKELCIPCSENLLEVTKRQLLPRHFSSFSLKDYEQTLVKNLTQMCASKQGS